MSIGTRIKGFFKGITASVGWLVFRPITRALDFAASLPVIAAGIGAFLLAIPFAICAAPFKLIVPNDSVPTWVKAATSLIWGPLAIAAAAVAIAGTVAAVAIVIPVGIVWGVAATVDKLTSPIIGNDKVLMRSYTKIYKATENEALGNLLEKAQNKPSWFRGWGEMMTGEDFVPTEEAQEAREEAHAKESRGKHWEPSKGDARHHVIEVSGREVYVHADNLKGRPSSEHKDTTEKGQAFGGR